jgi:hypothetical protein
MAEPMSEEELELAVARLEWAKAVRCLDIPAQATAVKWHADECDAVRAALSDDASAE